MPPVDLTILDSLLLHHPELLALRETPGGRVVVDAAPSFARLLIGAVEEAHHPLIDALQKSAAQEIEILQGLCRGNALKTMTTTVSVLTHLARLLDRQPPPEDDEDTDEKDSDEADTTQTRSEETDEEAEESDEDAEGFADALDADEMIEEAFSKVAAQDGVLDSLNQLLPGMGWGFGRGHLEEALFKDMPRFARLLERAQALRKITDELGRLERSERRRTARNRTGREAVVGVRFSGELADALPSELALLGSPSTSDLFYQRYTEQRLLSLELEGALDDPADAGKEGPVIACVDTSGSMEGPPEVIAKALILAVMRRVLPKGRRMRLMLFGGPGDFRDMDIHKGPGAMRHFLDFLAMRFNAGTDFDGPLQRALDLLEEERYEQADILLVTDGYGHARGDVVRRLERLRDDLGFEVVSVVVGSSPRGVASFSDRVWLVPPHSTALEDIDLSLWDGKK